MISLYILRHGEAEPTATSDAVRQLTERGKAQVSTAVESLPELDLMVVSPFVRAQESAHIVQTGHKIGRVQDSETLTPDVGVNVVMAWLEDVDVRTVLLVSHNPLVSELTDLLTGGNSARFGTGSLALLTGNVIAPGCMTLNWIR